MHSSYKQKIKLPLYRLAICFCPAILMLGSGSLVLAQVGTAKSDVQKVKETADERVFMVVEHQPKFPGGLAARSKFFSQNLVLPKTVLDMKTKKVFVSFIVNVDGSLQDIALLKSLHEEYDQEALRVVNLMPKWVPGSQSGKKVRVKYILPVEFQ
jgi:protein TonB